MGNGNKSVIIYLPERNLYRTSSAWFLRERGGALFLSIRKSCESSYKKKQKGEYFYLKTAESKGYGFVMFRDASVAKIAASTANRQILFDKMLVGKFLI